MENRINIASLEDCTTEDLESIRSECERIISKRKEADRKRDEEVLNSILAKHGVAPMSLSDLKSGEASKPKPRVKVHADKYQNPTDPQQRWSGYGRRPEWINQYVKAGGILKDLAI